MSQENVELLRSSIEDFLAGTSESDREGMLRKVAGVWDSEIELDASDSPVLDVSGIYRGRDAVGQFWQEWLSAWETLQFEYELVDAGDRRSHAVRLANARTLFGHRSALRKRRMVMTFRDGLVVHQKLYMSQSDALEAVGLPEQDAHADS
jgi:hypothetical protein